MAYTGFGAARSAVNNAGVYLRDYRKTLLIEDADKWNASLDVACRYRAEFDQDRTAAALRAVHGMGLESI
jgi:hypothetical protein